MTDNQMIDTLKDKGFYFAAGALAAQAGQDCCYGCHFGMRSGREAALRQFIAGWNAAHKG